MVGLFPPQVHHGIFSSALRAETYSENIAMMYPRLLHGQRKKIKEYWVAVSL
jgi:hypothetical protein